MLTRFNYLVLASFILLILISSEYILGSGLDKPLVSGFSSKFTGHFNGDKNKKPVVLYLAADTSEPFMRIAIDHEVSEIKKLCVTNTQTNAVIAISSQIKAALSQHHTPNITICEGGRIKLAPLTFHTENLAYELSESTPLANVQYLEQTLTYIIDKLFPSQKYNFFLQIKSHGYQNWVIVYSNEILLKNKIEKQNLFLEKEGMNIKLIKMANLGDGDLNNYYSTLKNEFEGKSTQTKELEFNKNTYTSILSDQNLGGGENAANGGLNEIVTNNQSQIGISEIQAYKIFKKLIDIKKAEFAFVFLEACNKGASDDYIIDKNLSNQEAHSFLTNSSIFFRAKGNLSYHNFSWTQLNNYIHKPDDLYYALLDTISDIPNRFPIDELYSSILNNDFEKFKFFIDTGFNIDSAFHQGKPLVGFLIKTGKINFFNYIVTKFPNHLATLAKNVNYEILDDIFSIKNTTTSQNFLQRIPELFKIQKKSIKQSQFEISSAKEIQFLNLIFTYFSNNKKIRKDVFNFLLKESGITPETLFTFKPLKSLRTLNLNLLEIIAFCSPDIREIVQLLLSNGYQIRNTIDSNWKILIELIDNLYPLNQIKSIASTLDLEMTPEIASELLTHVFYTDDDRLLGHQIMIFLIQNYKLEFNLDKMQNRGRDQFTNYIKNSIDLYYFALEYANYFRLNEQEIANIKGRLLHSLNCPDGNCLYFPGDDEIEIIQKTSAETNLISSILSENNDTAIYLLTNYIKTNKINEKFIYDLQNYLVRSFLILKENQHFNSALFNKNSILKFTYLYKYNMLDKLIDLINSGNFKISTGVITSSIEFGNFDILDKFVANGDKFGFQSVNQRRDIQIDKAFAKYAEKNNSIVNWNHILSYGFDVSSLIFGNTEKHCESYSMSFRKFLFSSKLFIENASGYEKARYSELCPIDENSARYLLSLKKTQNDQLEFVLQSFIERAEHAKIFSISADEPLSEVTYQLLQKKRANLLRDSLDANSSAIRSLKILQTLDETSKDNSIQIEKFINHDLLNSVLCNKPSIAQIAGYQEHDQTKTNQWMSTLLGAKDSITLSSEFKKQLSNDSLNLPQIPSVFTCLFWRDIGALSNNNFANFSKTITDSQRSDWQENIDFSPQRWFTQNQAIINNVNQLTEDTKLLIRFHPEILKMQDTLGRTYLHWSAYLGNWAIFKGLIDSGADVNVLDKNGKSVLDYLFDGKFLSINMLKLLKLKGFNFKQKTSPTYLEKLNLLDLSNFKILKPYNIYDPIAVIEGHRRFHLNKRLWGAFYNPENQYEAYRTFWALYLWSH